MRISDWSSDVCSSDLHARGAELFDAAKYPQATYTGQLRDFVDGKPTRVVGELTLHGVTRPVELEIRSFQCMPHPMLKRELCGADALATIQRAELGMAAGKAYGFSQADPRSEDRRVGKGYGSTGSSRGRAIR